MVLRDADVDLKAGFRVTRIYDLRGTMGIAFYWWGAANPPEALVDFIVETPTGFWLSSFYDGLAQFRYVYIPWGSFVWVSSPQRLLEPHHHGFNEPDKSQIDGFLWTVYTPGVRRIDYIHAPMGGDLPAEFTVRHLNTRNLETSFTVRRSALQNLFAELIVRYSGSEDLSSEFISRHTDTQNLKCVFTVNP